MNWYHIMYLVEQSPKNWVIEIIGAIVTIGGGLFLYLQNKNKNDSEVKIAKINTSSDVTLKQINDQFELIKKFEQQVISLEKQLKEEIKQHQITKEEINKLEFEYQRVKSMYESQIKSQKEIIKSAKTMISIFINQLSGSVGETENKALMITLKQIQEHMDLDEL